jgi:hypothetical protein
LTTLGFELFGKNGHTYEMRKQRIFSDETLKSLQELGEVLREIRNQLIAEGYTIRDGKIYPPHNETDSDVSPAGN